MAEMFFIHHINGQKEIYNMSIASPSHLLSDQFLIVSSFFFPNHVKSVKSNDFFFLSNTKDV